MRVVNDFGLVRVISTGADILVEVRNSDTSAWETFQKFNSFSDDYAYTNAREAAGQAIKIIAARKAQFPSI